MTNGAKTASSRGGELDRRASTATPRTPDSELIPRLLVRDERAFAELFDLYHGSLVRLAMLFVPSRAVAEEVAQETWLNVIDGVGEFERRSSLKTWIFRILVNRAKTRGERERRSIPFSALVAGEFGDEPAVDPERFLSSGRWGAPPRNWTDDTPESSIMTREGLKQLEKALDALPAGQRAVVTLRDIEGLDSEEVCNVLEITETNQRVLLHRARSKLRAVLEDVVERS